jgi:hypothetical protein
VACLEPPTTGLKRNLLENGEKWKRKNNSCSAERSEHCSWRQFRGKSSKGTEREEGWAKRWDYDRHCIGNGDRKNSEKITIEKTITLDPIALLISRLQKSIIYPL